MNTPGARPRRPGQHRARRVGSYWLFGVALGVALTVPLGLPTVLTDADRPRTPVPVLTTTTPPRTADSLLRPRGGCPPDFGPSPAISGVCVSPAPEVAPTPGTTTPRTRTTTRGTP